jgi:hypothetical protein
MLRTTCLLLAAATSVAAAAQTGSTAPSASTSEGHSLFLTLWRINPQEFALDTPRLEVREFSSAAACEKAKAYFLKLDLPNNVRRRAECLAK